MAPTPTCSKTGPGWTSKRSTGSPGRTCPNRAPSATRSACSSQAPASGRSPPGAPSCRSRTAGLTLSALRGPGLGGPQPELLRGRREVGRVGADRRAEAHPVPDLGTEVGLAGTAQVGLGDGAYARPQSHRLALAPGAGGDGDGEVGAPAMADGALTGAQV